MLPEVRSEGSGLEAHLAALEPEIPGMWTAIHAIQQAIKPCNKATTAGVGLQMFIYVYTTHKDDDLRLVYCWVYHIEPVGLWNKTLDLSSSVLVNDILTGMQIQVNSKWHSKLDRLKSKIFRQTTF